MDAQLLLALKAYENEKAPSARAPLESETLSISELCVVLGVSQTSCYRLIIRGYFTPLAGLRHLRIPKKQVRDYLEGRPPAAAKPPRSNSTSAPIYRARKRRARRTNDTSPTNPFTAK